MVHLTSGVRLLAGGARLALIVMALLALSGTAAAQAQVPRDLRWSVRELSDRQGEANTPAIVADTTGRIHLFWAQRNTEQGIGTIYYAQPRRTGWLITDVIPEAAANPRTAIDDAGTLHLLWLSSGSGNLRYSYAPVAAADSARAWAEPRTIVYGPAYSPQLLFDPAGILHVVYSTIADTSSEILYVRSLDGGRTWSRPAPIFESPVRTEVTDRPRLALAPNGTLHLVWGLIPKSSFYGGLGVYYARSADSGQTWMEPSRLRGPDEGAWQASIIAVTNDEVHVVWNAHQQSGRRHHQWSRDGGRTWTVPRPIWGSFVSQTGPNPMVVDSAGTLYLLSAGTFKWGERQGIYASRWTGAVWTEPALVDLASEEPHWPEVAVTEGNALHVIWEAREQKPRGVWYATARTPAPYVPPALLSYPEASAAVQPTPPAPVPVTSGTAPAPRPAMPVMTADGLGDNVGLDDPRPALGAGTLPVLALLGAVLLLQTLWLRRN